MDYINIKINEIQENTKKYKNTKIQENTENTVLYIYTLFMLIFT